MYDIYLSSYLYQSSKTNFMKIKNLSLVLLCIGTALTSFAQTSDAEAEAIVNLLGVQKKEAIAKLVSVSGKDSIAFWKLYE